MIGWAACYLAGYLPGRLVGLFWLAGWLATRSLLWDVWALSSLCKRLLCIVFWGCQAASGEDLAAASSSTCWAKGGSQA